MTIKEYIKDKVLMILLHIFCMLVLSGFLYVTGYQSDLIALILLCWGLILLLVYAVEFYQRKIYFSKMSEILRKTEKRYLLGELMPDSPRLTDRIYRSMILSSNKSVIEGIRSAQKEQREYREFVESWVHEIKAPITGIELLCENHKDTFTRQIMKENRKIENYVDMALYYARADEVYKDYMVRKTDLAEIVSSVLSKNKYYLIGNRVQVETKCTHCVYTDEKWISFILNQLILNCVKYKKGDSEEILIETKEFEKSVRLVVKDNGVGIRKEEIGRIFDKGFTGSNGRNGGRSTGMGLYLCHNLCEKLGIMIWAVSEEGTGTEMILEFPVGNFYAREES